MKSPSSRWMTLLFCAAVGLALVFQISMIFWLISWFLRHTNIARILSLVPWPFILEFLICQGVVLAFRLWLVFKDSTWQLSDGARNTFMVLCVLPQIATCVLVATRMFMSQTDPLEPDGVLVYVLLSLSTCLVIYAATAIIKQSTQYLILFLVAVLSTLLSCVSTAVMMSNSWVAGSVFDVVLNVLGLFFQIGFAKQHTRAQSERGRIFKRMKGWAGAATERVGIVSMNSILIDH